MECLQEWGPFIQLAIPSMLMLCLEWWLFEVGGFLAGVISEAELGSQSIIYELTVVAYMVKKKKKKSNKTTSAPSVALLSTHT